MLGDLSFFSTSPLYFCSFGAPWMTRRSSAPPRRAFSFSPTASMQTFHLGHNFKSRGRLRSTTSATRRDRIRYSRLVKSLVLCSFCCSPSSSSRRLASLCDDDSRPPSGYLVLRPERTRSFVCQCRCTPRRSTQLACLEDQRACFGSPLPAYRCRAHSTSHLHNVCVGRRD